MQIREQAFVKARRVKAPDAADSRWRMHAAFDPWKLRLPRRISRYAARGGLSVASLA
ncbi:MAG: hypothetical protein NTV94_10370 [Planctomycetota bacterium]|nr:hypothetical protein [Planctomycetota bacterium]